MKLDQLLADLTAAPGVSGREHTVSSILAEFFESGEGKGWVTEIRRDALGNLILYKAGHSPNPPRVMFAAHMDEIGLIVTEVKDGFVRFESVGGIDVRVLLAQEVVIHGRRDIPGVIGAKPPHIQDDDERSESVKIEDMAIDTGLSADELSAQVQVGDFVSISRGLATLRNDNVSGKALDDRAGVVALVECLRRLNGYSHAVDVYCVATTQEEVGLRGALVSAYGVDPDVGIAIDVTHGSIPGLADHESFDLGKGPALAIGPQVHPGVLKRLQDAAEEAGICCQTEPTPYPGGTDTYSIQMVRDGVPTALVSIPLKYMHTSVETASMKDIKDTGRLLAQFVIGLDSGFVEGLKCFWKS
jgi:putative aminopeptidase FrvX